MRAADILRLRALRDDNDRAVRIWRSATDAPGQLHLKTYRVGGLIPLSEAVPVLENFGFRVLEEIPTALAGGALGYIHDFGSRSARGRARNRSGRARAEIERAIADVLCGTAENDEFNQLVIFAGLDPRRWSGCAPGSAICARPEAASAW